MYCRNCGNKLNEGANFCGSCGTPVTTNLNNQTPIQSGIDPTYNQNINVQPVNKPVNSNKAPLIIVIILIVLGGIIFAGLFTIGIIVTILETDLESNSNNSTNNIGEKIYSKKIINNDMSFDYDITWTKLSDEDGVKTITKSNETIKLSYSTSNYYYTTAQAAEEIKEEIEDSYATIISDLEDIEINGITWKKIVCEMDSNVFLFLVYSNRYDIYVFSYTANNNVIYNSGINDVEKIYKTLKLDNSKQEQAEKKAKEKLIGEWDWGISGYFVIENDKIYVYKDSSKSMDNVFYGTYVADDKIATYGTGYVEGMYVIMTIEKYFINGEEKPLNGNSQIEFAFSPNLDGTYTIKNMSTYNSNTATKIK